MFDMTHLRAKNVHFMTSLMDLKYDARLHSLLALWLAWAPRPHICFQQGLHFYVGGLTIILGKNDCYTKKKKGSLNHFPSQFLIYDDD